MAGPYRKLQVFVMHHGKGAIQCTVEGLDGQCPWIPYSQIEDNGEALIAGYEGPIYVTEWLCEKKGII